MKKRDYWVLLAAAVIALTTAVFTTAALAATTKPAPITGAIFTTDQCSNFVDGNVYDAAFTTTPSSDCALGKGNYPTVPYLNGGPRPNARCDAAGLPDGHYYFQVTDPSGSMLLHDLATDPVSEREVVVEGGLITKLGSSVSLRLASLGIGKCGNISVELFPFNETPNPGGEYKVWMIPVGSYDPTKGFYGFIPSQSKTDNFKVVAPEGIVCPGDPACPV